MKIRPVSVTVTPEAGAYHVAADLAAFEFVGPGSGKRAHGRFGGVVQAQAFHAIAGADGCRQHDGSTVFEQRQQGLYGEENALHVDIEQAVIAGFAGLTDRVLFADAGIGEHHVERAIALLYPFSESIQIGLPADVGDHRNRPFTQRGHRASQRGGGTPGDVNAFGAFGEQRLGDGKADTS